ncbi:alpha-2-macroglobulin family protein [Bdellovibrio sp. HCB-110]|uniref:alpha-2-macroglobulin family protein n=1 Tax=Bdellovibrio sp. HCB-110 TaxID=3391182 RepID=UPI0039B47D2D
MKNGILSLSAFLFLSFVANAKEQVKDFNGVIPEPVGKVTESFSQLRIKFPSTIDKSKNGQKEAFKVSCSPAMEGYSSWADNDTLWTYNFKAKDEYSSNNVVGGTKCSITQLEDLSSNTTTWKAGTVNYTVIASGPNVQEVYAARGFQGTLRDIEPVLMIVFDGPVDRSRFFTEQSGVISYLSANAPAEKMPLVAVPLDQSEKLFSYFTSHRYMGVEYKDKNWILATLRQNLIPGAQVNLTVENQASADNSDVRSEKKFTKEFSVRSQFQAKIQCANPSAKNATCLPRSAITVVMNGHTKWMDVKESYIEYIPYKSTDGKLVRSYPELNQEVGLWDSIIDILAEYFPFLAKYSDTIVDSINFNVNIEPETQAKVVLPPGLKDIESRLLSNAIAEFHIRIGTMSEVIHVPQEISVFEKNVPNLYLPVGIVNLNQKISIRKTGTDDKVWEPIRDVTSMINIIRAYESRGAYRHTPVYTSPLETLGVANTVVEQQLTGPKNRPLFLQFPFADAGKSPASGFYPIEVSSPTFEAGRSYSDEDQYFNPKYVLAQVTDLAVHLKKGKVNTVVWVTSLSGAQPLAGADVEIYNCLGQQVKTLKTDASGLTSFENQEWAANCNAPGNAYSSYFEKDSFYVVAKVGEDLTLTHSSWASPSTYAMAAPGIDWYYSDINENQPHFHSVVGVNLVKPGQQVPIELIAKIPHAKGFSEVAETQLPLVARVISAEDRDVYYELQLTWKNGVSNIVWDVPSDSTVKLGRYYIELIGTTERESFNVAGGDIEVAEFKVPLMSGIMSFPTQALVQPDTIPVNSVIRYANGVGAKNLSLDISYYFESTSLKSKNLGDFSFGNGAVKLSEDESSGDSDALPTHSRPATIPDLKTGDDGSLVRDLALEKVADGRSVAEVLKTLDHPKKLVARVRYKDQMGEFQTLSQAKVIYNSQEYVGTHLISGSRAEARLRAAIVDVDQKNVTDLRNLEIKVIRVETKVIGEELYGGLIKNTLERELKPVRWTASCSMQKQVASCKVGTLKAGNYAFQVMAKNSKQTAHTFFKVDSNGRVYGASDYYGFGDGESQKQLPLALNKKEYKDGERAVVSFSAPFKACRALLTVERHDVMEASLVTNACDKGFVEVPVNATYAPNAFVSVYAITGRAQAVTLKPGEIDLGRPTYRLGYANMKVNWSRFRSNVAIKINKEKFQPGESVEGEVQVKAEEGVLVNGTVTLVAIEEKILELKNNETYKILEALMQLRGHGVETVTPLERVETVTSTDNTDIPSENTRKGGDEGGDGDGSTKADFKRRLFNALVSFQPGIPVVNGVAKFSFNTNDSLTRFKIFAITTDSGQKFGTGEAVYLTEKDTQAYSNIPSVAHHGDTYPVRVTVQNNSAKTSKFKTEVEVVVRDASGKEIGRKVLTKQAEIEPSGSESVDLGDFTISEDANRIEYVVRIYDENGNLVDSLEPEAQVILPSVPLAIHNSYIVQLENGSFTHELTKELGALPGKGEIRVSLSNSLVSGAIKQIQQRVAQDMFADFFTESRFHKALLNSTEAKPDELKKVLDTLMGSVDANGFVKYYPQARRGSLWLTASILNSLQQEPWALKLIPVALSQKLKGAVSQVLTKSVDPIYVGKAPLDWVRAQSVMGRSAYAFQDQNLQASAKAVSVTIATELQRNPAAFGPTVDKWSNSDLVNVWLLHVFATPETALTSPIYAQLLSPSRLVYTGNMAQLKGAPSYGFFYSDETTESANLLLGHAKLRADKNIARSLAVGLVNVNTKAWYNTATMAMVAQGLKTFARSYESEIVTGSSLVAIPEERANGSVDWSKSSSVEVATPWTHNKATVQVSHAGQGSPWVGVQGLTAVPLTAPRGLGLSVEKNIRNVNRESGYQAGDVIEVTLRIQASGTVGNVAMQDPIPAGSNILSDAYGSYSSGQKSYSGYKFYFEVLPSGVTTVKYQFQLNNPGTFKLPPTRAEALYTPSVFGEAPNATFIVK